MNVNDLKLFKQLLGYSESGGNYSNDLGEYWGKYQFGNARRLDISRALKIASPTRAQFTPELQEKFFDMHVKMLENELKPLYSYIGKQVTGKNKFPKTVTINLFGLIGGAHLGGATGLENFLRFGIDKKDKLGTYISDYVAKFSLKMEEKKKNNP